MAKPLSIRHLLGLGLVCGLVAACATTSTRPDPMPKPAIDTALNTMIAQHEISGAVTAVVNRDGLTHLSAVGLADIDSNRAMVVDDIAWIASMTKPITAVAVLMLQDAGKLSVDDHVAKYIPAFAGLKTANGKEVTITLRHLLTHTSGLSESTQEERDTAKQLADLIPGITHRALQFAPGSQWRYCQSGINSLGRIVEIVSGQSFPEFLQQRLFTPLGMIDTTFYPNAAQQKRLATVYKKDGEALVAVGLPRDFDPANVGHYPAPNGGLFSTARDYAQFCRMLLNDGRLDGRNYLSTAAVTQLRTLSTAELKTGFTPGNGWGLGVCVVREPQGVSAALSAGSYGHGGAYGTQAWIDPTKGMAYILIVQRQNFPNSDNSDVRRVFQEAAQH